MKGRITGLLFWLALSGFSQVPKRVVVEHFTNSLCSVCASQNPGFYSNLSAHPQVLHLAYYPSAPYQDCVFNQQSQPKNDARCNYYGVYGATPRFVVQGEVKTSNTGISSPSFFLPYFNQLTPFELRVDLGLAGSDSIEVRTMVRSTQSHSLSNLKLYIAITEDTIFYTGPNGETEHFDVFRDSPGAAAGDALSPGLSAGDSIVVFRRVKTRAFWNLERVRATAILQDAGKAVLQSAMSMRKLPATGLSQGSEPCCDKISVAGQTLSYELIITVYPATLLVFDMLGNKVSEKILEEPSGMLDLSGFNAGLYFYRISDAVNVARGRFLLK